MVNVLDKMFSTLPLPAANANPAEALRTYYEVCQPFSTEDVELAVKQFLSGSVKDFNPNFAPTPPKFAKQLRANAEYRAKTNTSHNLLLEQFKEQEKDEEFRAHRTPEAKARVQSMLDAIKEETVPKRTPEEAARAKAMLEKQDQYYAADFVETPDGRKVSSYLLGKLRTAGYTTFNAADDDDHDLGQMGAA